MSVEPSVCSSEGFFSFDLKERLAMKEKVVIIGVGKVGLAVGYLLKKQGCHIAGVCARHRESVDRAVRFIGGEPSRDAAEASRLGDVVLLTTGDDQIQPVCEEIASKGGFRKGQKVIHMSGASSLDVLKSARDSGADILSVHPLQAFATVEGAIEQLPGTVFGVTAENHLVDWANNFVRALGGKPIRIADEQKAIYHAAACVVSNYFVTLMWIGKNMAIRAGIPEKLALDAYWPLVRGTFKNLEKNTPAEALTGPIARGDIETIKEHRRKLRRELRQFLKAYDVLGRHTVEVAIEKGTIDQKTAKKLLEELGE